MCKQTNRHKRRERGLFILYSKLFNAKIKTKNKTNWQSGINYSLFRHKRRSSKINCFLPPFAPSLRGGGVIPHRVILYFLLRVTTPPPPSNRGANEAIPISCAHIWGVGRPCQIPTYSKPQSCPNGGREGLI